VDLLDALLTPSDVEVLLAQRLRAERRRRQWTQAELARRANLSIATIARFEQSGQGQVASLLQLCTALGRLAEWGDLLRPPPPTSLDDLRRRS
jgi:HTH-type transcriptional regulator / antitoxin HipB